MYTVEKKVLVVRFEIRGGYEVRHGRLEFDSYAEYEAWALEFGRIATVTSETEEWKLVEVA